MAFCRGCHAPAADPSRPTPDAAREAGIRCIDCHAGMPVTHGSVGTASGPAGHVAHAPAARACATCHEFRFPDGPTLMQKTATEHAKSAHARKACGDCHMRPVPGPGGKPHRDHRFDVDAMVPGALVADVARASETRVAFRLSAGEIGHAFPTGDLFRRVSVRAEEVREGQPRDPPPGPGQPRDRRPALAVRHLQRHFRSVTLPGGVPSKVEERDDRVGAGLAPCFELEVGERARGAALRVEIALERVEQPRPTRGSDAEISSRVPAFERLVSPAPEGFRPCP